MREIKFRAWDKNRELGFEILQMECVDQETIKVVRILN